MQSSLAIGRTIRAAILACSIPAIAFAGPTPPQKCEGGKNDASGKYVACIAKAQKSYVGTGDMTALGEAVAKCEAKHVSSFSKLEDATLNQGFNCPTTGDQSAIEDYLTVCADQVAGALSGGSLGMDPATCNNAFAGCNDDLDFCEGDLDTCESDLGDCETERDACLLTGGHLTKTGQTTCYNDSPGTVISCSGTQQDGAQQAGDVPNFVDNGNGTVTDYNTGLMWEKLSDNGNIHDKDNVYSGLSAAYGKITSLNSASFAGFNDWRMPNNVEMISIIDYGRDSPAVKPIFHTGCVGGCNGISCACTPNQIYQTSTTYRMFPEANWRFNMTDGDMYAGYKTDTNLRVRAVRTAF